MTEVLEFGKVPPYSASFVATVREEKVKLVGENLTSCSPSGEVVEDDLLKVLACNMRRLEMIKSGLKGMGQFETNVKKITGFATRVRQILTLPGEWERVIATIQQVNLKAVLSEVIKAIVELDPKSFVHVEVLTKLVSELHSYYGNEFATRFSDALSKRLRSLGLVSNPLTNVLDFDINFKGFSESDIQEISSLIGSTPTAKHKTNALILRQMCIDFTLMCFRLGIIPSITPLISGIRQGFEQALQWLKESNTKSMKVSGKPKREIPEKPLTHMDTHIQLQIETGIAFIALGRHDVFNRLAKYDMCLVSGSLSIEEKADKPLLSEYDILLKSDAFLGASTLELSSIGSVKGNLFDVFSVGVDLDELNTLKSIISQLFEALESRAQSLMSCLKSVIIQEHWRKLMGKGEDQSKFAHELEESLSQTVRLANSLSCHLSLRKCKVDGSLSLEEKNEMLRVENAKIREASTTEEKIEIFRKNKYPNQKTREMYEEILNIEPFLSGDFAFELYTLVSIESLVIFSPLGSERSIKKDKKDKSDKKDKKSKKENLKSKVSLNVSNYGRTGGLLASDLSDSSDDESDHEMDSDYQEIVSKGGKSSGNEVQARFFSALQTSVSSLDNGIIEDVTGISDSIAAFKEISDDDLNDILKDLGDVRTVWAADEVTKRICYALETEFRKRCLWLLVVFASLASLGNEESFYYFSRVVASLSKYLPPLMKSLDRVLFLRLKKDIRSSRDLKSKLKTIQFISELTKFGLLSPIELWRWLLSFISKRGAPQPVTNRPRLSALHAAQCVYELLKGCGLWLCGDDSLRSQTLHLLAHMDGMIKNQILASTILEELIAATNVCNVESLQAAGSISITEALVEFIFSNVDQGDFSSVVEGVECVCRLTEYGKKDCSSTILTQHSLSDSYQEEDKNLKLLLEQFDSMGFVKTPSGKEVRLDISKQDDVYRLIRDRLLSPELFSEQSIQILCKATIMTSELLQNCKLFEDLHPCRRFKHWLIDAITEKFIRQLESNDHTERQDRIAFGKYIATLWTEGFLSNAVFLRLLFEVLCRYRNDPKIDPPFDSFRILLILSMLNRSLGLHQRSAIDGVTLRAFLLHFAAYIHSKKVIPLDLFQDIIDSVSELDYALLDLKVFTSAKKAHANVMELNPLTCSQDTRERNEEVMAIWRQVPNHEEALFQNLETGANTSEVRSQSITPSYLDFVMKGRKDSQKSKSDLSVNMLTSSTRIQSSPSQNLTTLIDNTLRTQRNESKMESAIEKVLGMTVADVEDVMKLTTVLTNDANNEDSAAERISEEQEFEAEFRRMMADSLIQTHMGPQKNSSLKSASEYLRSPETKAESERVANSLKDAKEPGSSVQFKILTRGEKKSVNAEYLNLPSETRFVKSFVNEIHRKRNEEKEFKRITLGLIERQRIEEFLEDNGFEASSVNPAHEAKGILSGAPPKSVSSAADRIENLDVDDFSIYAKWRFAKL